MPLSIRIPAKIRQQAGLEVGKVYRLNQALFLIIQSDPSCPVVRAAWRVSKKADVVGGGLSGRIRETGRRSWQGLLPHHTSYCKENLFNFDSC